MKRFIYIVCGIMIISFAIGMSIMQHAGGFRIETKEMNDTKKFAADWEKTVEIKTVSEKITVSPSDSKEIAATLKGKAAGSADYKIDSKENKESGALEIEIDRPDKTFIIGDLNDLELNISIPREYKGELSVESVSGKISINNFSLPLIEAKTTSGQIVLSDISGETKAKTISGRINFNPAILSANATLSSVSGRVSVGLPKEASCLVKFDTESGSFHNNTNSKFDKSRRQDYEGTIGDGKQLLTVTTTSGGFDLEN